MEQRTQSYFVTAQDTEKLWELRPQPGCRLVAMGTTARTPRPLLLAPDPFSWHIAHQTRHNLGQLPENNVSQRAPQEERFIPSLIPRICRPHRSQFFGTRPDGLRNPGLDIFRVRHRRAGELLE